MTSMFSMHEDVKERAKQNDQPRKPAQKMGTMLRDEVEAGNRKEADQGDGGGSGPAALLLASIAMMWILFHATSMIGSIYW